MTRKKGIDLSKWQLWWRMVSGVIVPDFAILRAGYAMMPDKLFDTFYQAGIDKGVDLGAYHYFSSGAPWRDQLAFFLKQVKGKKIKKYALDIETAYNNMSKDFALSAVKWIHGAQDATGIETVLYTNPYTYKDHLRRYTPAVDDFKLWIAQYPDGKWTAFTQKLRETMNGKPWLKPTGRHEDDWWAWQYTKSAPGHEYGVGSKTVDANILNGDQTFVSDDLPDDPLPTPEEIAPLLYSAELGDYLVELRAKKI